MGNWRVALGNLVDRSGPKVTPLAGTPSSLYPLERVGTGHPDDPGAWAHGGVLVQYSAQFDLSLLETSSPRSDAPTGWRDLSLYLAGTPGLPVNPPNWGTYAARAGTLQAFWPSFQDVRVWPGETLRLRGAGYIDTGGGGLVDEIRVRVRNLNTGREFDGAVWSSSAADAVSITTLDAWTDFDVSIPPELAEARDPATYRVVLYGLDAGVIQGGASAPFYVSWHSGDEPTLTGPGLTGSQGILAVVGHNLGRASVVWRTVPTPSAVTWSLTSSLRRDSFFYVPGAAETWRAWRLDIQPETPDLDPAPFLGELWVGPLTDLVWCPAFPFELTADDPGQVRLQGGYGRQNVYSDAARERLRLRMNFEADEDGYRQARHFLENGTRHGADPLLILPVDVLEGDDAFYHARLGNEVAYSRTNLARRRFVLRADEDPFPRI